MRAVVVEPDHTNGHSPARRHLDRVRDHAAAQAHGLATPGGEVSDTGVAGLTLGGGIGWLSRRHGLSCDNLLSVDLVTAGGDLLQADEQTHPELFWAVRGGGGDFGVVTAFRFRLHPVGDVLAGPILYPADQAPEVLPSVQDLATTLPDDLALNVVLATMPPTPDTPPPLRESRTLLVVPAWFGDPITGRLVIDELRRIGKPLADAVAPTPYTALQSTMDPMTPPACTTTCARTCSGPWTAPHSTPSSNNGPPSPRRAARSCSAWPAARWRRTRSRHVRSPTATEPGSCRSSRCGSHPPRTRPHIGTGLEPSGPSCAPTPAGSTSTASTPTRTRPRRRSLRRPGHVRPAAGRRGPLTRDVFRLNQNIPPTEPES